MQTPFLWKGLFLGFSIAAPVGPIGVLCIRRTLVHGRRVGLASGLGAATADAIYGGIAGFGLTAVMDLLIGAQSGLRLIGGLFLCYLGVKTFLATPAEESTAAPAGRHAGAFASTFFLTLTNPMTILSFVAVFAGMGLAGARASYASTALLVAGVFAGSALWWLILSGSVGWMRAKITPRRLRWVNRLSGMVIFGFGALALFSLAALAVALR